MHTLRVTCMEVHMESAFRLRRWLVRAVLLAAIAAPAILGADGLIIVQNPGDSVPGHFSFAPLSVTYHHVSVAITDLAAVTTVDEEFYNPGDQRLEGTYMFPLPAGAQIDSFSMDINGTMTKAELLPADKARAFYEDIVRKMKDPALLEYVGRGAFQLRIYPIEPRSGKRIIIKYSQLLTNDGGLVTYTYPLNTEKFSSAALKDASVSVTLDGKQPLRSVYCPSHPAEIRRDGDRRAVVGWEGRDVWPDSDFTVMFSRTPSPLGIDLQAVRSTTDDGYFMLLASPGAVPDAGGVQPKDICFVLDTSGSMAGAKLQQAKKAIEFCLANLGTQDRFEIVRFSTEAEPFFGSLVPADKSHVDQAVSFVESLNPIGGTAIEDALDRALALRASGGAGAARPYLVIFLTDGLPTVGETSEDTLVARASRAGSGTRIFTFGIGNDVNTHLLDRIASETRAVSQYVLPKEDIEVKLSSFYAKIRDPVLSGLSLSINGSGIRVTRLQPSTLPDLFSGDMLVVFGRYSGSGTATARITGTFNGTQKEFSAQVTFPAHTGADTFVPRMWATRRVGWLLDEMRLHGESGELRDEVIRLARDFGIVTPYTAYLVVEDEEQRNVPAQMRSFQDLEKDKGAMDDAQSRLDSVRKEATSEASRAGAPAVANSQALQDLKSSTNLQQSLQGQGLARPASPSAVPGGYRDFRTQNYAQQAQVVNGRAFYLNGTTWTDSTAQAGKKLAQMQLKFASADYFTFMSKHPDAAQWLALGSNVDLVVDGVLVSVRE